MNFLVHQRFHCLQERIHSCLGWESAFSVFCAFSHRRGAGARFLSRPSLSTFHLLLHALVSQLPAGGTFRLCSPRRCPFCRGKLNHMHRFKLKQQK